MGCDKSLLPVDGVPMIEYVLHQVRPYFRHILVSAEDAGKYAFLGVPVVPDEVPGQGALMGIASALAASPAELNFVVACDIPDIDIGFVKGMFAQAEGYDGVVPVSGESRFEPLFAVYRKTVAVAATRLLADGRRRISAVFELCRIKYIDLTGAGWLKNLNTAADYRDFLKYRQEGRPEGVGGPHVGA